MDDDIPREIRALETRDAVIEFLTRGGPHKARIRAAAEAWLWKLTPRERRENGKKKAIGALASEVGATTYDIEIRHRLHRAGRDADAVWAKLERGLTLATAVRLLREGEASACATGKPVRDEVARLVASYDAQGFFVKTYRGFFRKSYQKTASPPERDVSTPSPSTSGPAVAEAASSPSSPSTIKPLVDRISRAVRAEAKDKLGAVVDDRELADILGPVLVEIEGAVRFLDDRISAFQQKRSRDAHADGVIRALVTRKRLVAACHVLGMDPPPIGKPADLKIARRNRGKLGAAYHVDRVGNDSMREQYEAVMGAYDTIASYNERLAPEAPASVTNGVATATPEGEIQS